MSYKVEFENDYLILTRPDSKKYAFPLKRIAWFNSANESQKENWQIIANEKIYWPDFNDQIELFKFHSIGKCKLCLLPDKVLQKKSHIIPKFIFKQSGIVDEKGKINEVIYDAINKVIVSKNQASENDYMEKDILCIGCDHKILNQNYEDYISKILYSKKLSKRIGPSNQQKVYLTHSNNATVNVFENIEKGKMKLFILSIIWRCSISRLSRFKEIHLGKYEEEIRKMILNNDAGNDDKFSFAVFSSYNNSYWSEDTLRIPIRDRFINGSYYKMILGGFIYVINISFKEINSFFRIDGAKLHVYDLPPQMKPFDFVEGAFIGKIWNYFSNKN